MSQTQWTCVVEILTLEHLSFSIFASLKENDAIMSSAANLSRVHKELSQMSFENGNKHNLSQILSRDMCNCLRNMSCSRHYLRRRFGKDEEG